LAIATRADPPLPLARLRARGELLEVRAENLRFTAPEAYELLRSGGVELGPSEIEELVGRTEGWAAALRLAAVSLQGRPNQAELVRRFGASHRFVLDYVVEEVLAGLPPETQDFLLRTSILERLNASLCEAVTEERNGQFRLEALERANLLIVPLDNERYWYRYHALFAQILQARLGTLYSDEINQLHARASVWYEKRGDDDEAIAHALKSGDLGRAGRIVSDASFAHMNAGELSTVRRWLEALPPEVVRGHAQLSAWSAWCLVLAGETKGVAERLADAERVAASGGDDASTPFIAISTQVAMVRSQLAGLEGDTATAIAQARIALQLELVHGGLSTNPEASLRGSPAILLGLALARSGDLSAAAQAYEDALPDLRVANNVLAVGRGIADLAAIAIALGDPARALRLCESELSRGDGESSVAGSGAVWAALARARAELGQIELADAAARHSVELASLAGDAPALRSAQTTLARIAPLLAAGAASSQSSLNRTVAAPVENLTIREIEVLRLVALGRSNSQIAAELFVTVGTVKSHLHTVAGKLGAANRVEAVARGRELGLLV
jgi:LuxR family maltose regulon positive regulatory protein